MKKIINLRRRLLILASLGLLPAFTIITLDQINTRSQRIAEAEAGAERMTEIVLGEVIRGMTGAATLMIGMRHSAELWDEAGCVDYLADVRQDIPSAVDLAVADGAGQIFCHSGVSMPSDLGASVADIISSASAGGLQVGTYTSTPAGAALPMAMALPHREGRGQIYIYLNVILTELERLVGGATDGGTGVTIVADRDGTVLMRLPQGRLSPGDSLPEGLAAWAVASEPGTTRATDSEGIRRILAYRPVTAAPPISVFFGVPEALVLAPLNQAAVVNTLIAAMGTGLAVLLAWLMGRSWIQLPVDRLHHAVFRRRLGDRATRTGFEDDGTEFGSIGSSIDHLFDELDARERAQKLAEEQRDLSAREVQHRVKNLLAVIQVIAKQTLSRKDNSPEIRSFEGRIDTIVRANAALLAEKDQGGDLASIAREALEPFVGPDAERISLAGPELQIIPKVGFTLAMVLYELATNATKYGALSVPDGKVEITWSLEQEIFRLAWRERNGPPVDEPESEGFGTLMIRRVLAAETSGRVKLHYDGQGLSCSLEAPAERVVSQLAV